jgi:hypothetical protein
MSETVKSNPAIWNQFASGISACEYQILRGCQLSALRRDARRMTLDSFMRKHGVDVRHCRASLKRLRELAEAKAGANDKDVRELVGYFEAIFHRNAN